MTMIHLVLSLALAALASASPMMPFRYECTDRGCCGLPYIANSGCAVTSPFAVNTCYGDVLCYENENHGTCLMRLKSSRTGPADTRFQDAQVCMEQRLCDNPSQCTGSMRTQKLECVQKIRVECKSFVCALSPAHSWC